MATQNLLSKLVPPGQKRRGKRPPGGVIQVWVTRACDRACYHCTQGSNFKLNRPNGCVYPYTFMPVDYFEEAVVTLKDYFGIVGLFGGNPALHPEFPVLCEIIRRHIPKERAGIWCNHPITIAHARAMASTFSLKYSNLNVHLSKLAAQMFREGWPQCRVFGEYRDSRHPPVFVSMRDLMLEVEEREKLIANCDINKHWSAMVGMFRGHLRAWFCEIAGAQSILHQNDPSYPDTGVPVVPGWWKLSMDVFEEQVDQHCHACGVPLRGYGELANSPNGVEQLSSEHVAVCIPKSKDRRVQIVTSREELRSRSLRFTDYLGGACK